LPVHSTHVFVAMMHTGVGAAQLPALTHCTHVFVVVSHAGALASVQSLFAAHCTHAPATHAPLPHSVLPSSHFVEHWCCVVQNSGDRQSACDAQTSLLFEFELLEHASGAATSAASNRYCIVMFPSPLLILAQHAQRVDRRDLPPRGNLLARVKCHHV